MRSLSVLLALLVILVALQPAAALAPTRTLDRDLDPVITTGAALPAFNNVALSQLFVYAYTAGAWSQIPFQFDEVQGGKVVASGDGKLSAADQLVVMAADTGDQAPLGAWIADPSSRSYTRYEIAVTDPTSPAKRGWAYVYRSTTLTVASGNPYVTYDAGTRTLASDRYRLGLMNNKLGAESIKLNGSDTDILDRTKLRVTAAGVTSPLNEDTLVGTIAVSLRKGGRVRQVVVVGGSGLDVLTFYAYRSQFQYVLDLDLSSLTTITSIRLSADLAPAASGSVYYDSNTPNGVTIDGVPDTVATTPSATWLQIGNATGTFVEVPDWSGSMKTGTVATTYFKDNSAVDANDTGDKMSYGDAGASLSQPSSHLRAVVDNFVLPGGLPVVGARYQGFAAQPLQVQASAQSSNIRHVFLPRALRVGQ